MQAGKGRSHGEITKTDVYISGDEIQPGNQRKRRNSGPNRRRCGKDLNKRSLLLKQTQTAETLEWLSQNYELIHGVCVPRCVLYTHYLDFCKKRRFSPAGPATFGKLIRQRFPKLTTRRLGTRGQSKYHYYGISIKESSVYYHSVYSGKGLTRFSGTEGRKKGITKKFCFDKKNSNTLPEFPSASEMILGDDLQVEKVETFIIMYRTHCQRLLDTVMNANFDEVHKFLLHFWRGMPQHMIPVLECDAVIDIIVVCDSLLYKILNDVLVPSSIQDIPDSLTEEIQQFAGTFIKSLESCLENTPELLRNQKIRVAKNFVRLLKRNMTFIHLAQTARPVFLSYESMSGILNEFHSLDLRKILSELLFLTEQKHVRLPELLMFMKEFENLLVKQAPIEAYAEWFDSIVEEYVLKDDTNTTEGVSDLSEKSKGFLTSWSFITSRILQELTLKGAPTFGSFQLIIMMFEEYILLIIENQMVARLDEDLKQALTRHWKTASDVREANLVQESSETKHQTRHKDQLILNQQQRQRFSKTSNASKEQEILMIQNIQQEFQQIETSKGQEPNANNSLYQMSQQTSELHPRQMPEINFPTREVYMGINAVQADIYRIENSTAIQPHVYNIMYTQNQGNHLEFTNMPSVNSSRNSFPRTARNNLQAPSLITGNAYKYQFDTYALETGQDQSIEVQSQGTYQGQGQSAAHGHFHSQSYFHDKIHAGHQTPGKLDQGHQGQGHHRQSESQHAQGLEFQSHHTLGQNESHFKNFQYEDQLHNLDSNQEYSSQKQVHYSVNESFGYPDQNVNYSQTSTSSNNYLYTENMSVDRLTDQDMTYTTEDQSNIDYQGMTTLPSFFQLSTQLSRKTRLSGH